MLVPDIADRAWVAARIEAGATVTSIAAAAAVTRQTAYTWIARHRLEVEPRRKPRPEPQRLAAMYDEHRSARLVGEILDVSTDTARRWLHEAGVELDGRSRGSE